MATIVFGGSFNPPHLGHFSMAKAALQQIPHADFIWMPAACSPFKTDQTMAEEGHRYQMCLLMAQEDPRMCVSDLEFTLDKPSYTVRTLQCLLEQKADDYYFLCGADSFLSLFGWKEIDTLAKMVTFLVANRDGNKVALLEEQKSKLQSIGGTVLFLPMKEYPVSSTLLRENLKNSQTPPDGLHPRVFRYIQENNLYKE